MATKLYDLISFIDEQLTPSLFKDYCPNGLQVEGRSEVKKVVSGVTASQALIDAAIEQQADLLLVHHGFFWKGENSCITGVKRKRLKALLENDISLLAYHLPLDAHPQLGNNAQLADKLNLKITGGLEVGNPRSIGLVGELEQEMSADEFVLHVEQALGRTPMLVAGGSHSIKRIGWCTGGAQGYIEKAVDLGLDAYLSGEISEPTVHSARENGIHYFAAGHHATERYGVQALGELLALQFGVQHQYIEIDNPV